MAVEQLNVANLFLNSFMKIAKLSLKFLSVGREFQISEHRITGSLLYIACDSKLLSGFLCPIIFKPETTK
jgi:hypothetical protein